MRSQVRRKQRLVAGDGGGRRGVIGGIRREQFENASLVTLSARGHTFKTKIDVLEALGSDSTLTSLSTRCGLVEFATTGARRRNGHGGGAFC
jgi:ribosomal protein S4E